MFKKAERKRVYPKIAITGPSGSGKTMGALRLARGLVGPKGKIAAIDTENDSASLYADMTPNGGKPIEFDSQVMAPPFKVFKYTQMILDAVKAGYDVLLIDSITHAWEELLAAKAAKDKQGGNSFTNWGDLSREHEDFKNALLQSRIPIIVTMRSKQEYILEVNDKGKQAPRKVGMAPIQRDGMEYEFAVVFDVSMAHMYSVSKDRTNLFDGKIETLTEATGESLAEWLRSGKELAPEDPPPPLKKDVEPPFPPTESPKEKSLIDKAAEKATAKKTEALDKIRQAALDKLSEAVNAFGFEPEQRSAMLKQVFKTSDKRVIEKMTVEQITDGYLKIASTQKPIDPSIPMFDSEEPLPF